MISVVIGTRDSEVLLASTLAALVPGAVAGLVREVIVADSGSTDRLPFPCISRTAWSTAERGSRDGTRRLASIPEARKRAGHSLDRRGSALRAGGPA